jgi:hypothetical protein
MGRLLPVHEAHQMAHAPVTLIPPHIKGSRRQPLPTMRHCRPNLAAGAPSGFLLPAAARSRDAAVGSVLPKPPPSSQLSLDLKPPKPYPEPPLPDYLLPTAVAPPFGFFVAATIALHRISRQGDALTSRCALPLKRRLKNHGGNTYNKQKLWPCAPRVVNGPRKMN